jgi:hypothetical protein
MHPAQLVWHTVPPLNTQSQTLDLEVPLMEQTDLLYMICGYVIE